MSEEDTVVLERETVEWLVEGASHLYECAFPYEERNEQIREAVANAEEKL